MIWDVHPGSGFFFPSQIPDPGIKKAPDPGSATLLLRASTIPTYKSYSHTTQQIIEIKIDTPTEFSTEIEVTEIILAKIYRFG
jgi:hypothetical protein